MLGDWRDVYGLSHSRSVAARQARMRQALLFTARVVFDPVLNPSQAPRYPGLLVRLVVQRVLEFPRLVRHPALHPSASPLPTFSAFLLSGSTSVEFCPSSPSDRRHPHIP